MNLRSNILILSAISLCSVGTVLCQPAYYEPWEPDYYQRFEDIRLQVLAHALLAPNAHNRQPWLIRLNERDPSTFELFVDPDRLLPATDPPARQITISQGTFLEIARIAALELGYQVEFDLFPLGVYGTENLLEAIPEKPVARVSLDRISASSKQELYPAIFNRVTNRTAYFGDPLTDDELRMFQGLNDFSDLQLLFFHDVKSLNTIRGLTIAGVQMEATTESTILESQEVFRDTEKEKNKHRDGLTMMSGGLKGFKLHLLQFFSKTFPISSEKFGQFWIDMETRNINSTPTFAMIVSKDNSRISQVNTGRLYVRFQLKASLLGISMQPLSQVLQEFPEMAELYAKVHEVFAANGQTIQMLVRIGRADDVLHSPRRDVTDLIKVEN